MSTNGSGNGNKPYYRFIVWSLGVTTAIALGGGGSYLIALTARVANIEAMQYQRGERISKAETQIDNLDSRLDWHNERLNRLESARP